MVEEMSELYIKVALREERDRLLEILRVLPEDAFYANTIVFLQYKLMSNEDTGDGSYIMVRYKARSLPYTAVSSYIEPKAFNKLMIATATSLAQSEYTVDEADGWTTVPFGYVRAAGRGAYGNSYAFRVSNNLNFSTDYGIAMFSFEAMNGSTGTLSVEQTSVGSLVTSEKYKALTLVNDVIEEYEIGEAVLNFYVFEDNVSDVYDTFIEFYDALDPEDTYTDASGAEIVVKDSYRPDVDQFDIVQGLIPGTLTYHKNIRIESSATSEDSDVVDLDGETGITLINGTDGSFGSTDPEVVENALDGAYIKAFNGEYDRSILSTRRTETDFLLDANYNLNVKAALRDLAVAREAGLAYLDAGVSHTYATLENLIDNFSVLIRSDEDMRCISKNIQHYTIKEPSTRKKVEVSITYYFAQRLAQHFISRGSHIPFVKSYAELSGHVKNTLEPSIDDVDNDLKELLYVNRFNYFETIAENTYQRATQNTAQQINSDLLEENNMNTLFEIKKIVERDCWNSLYNFTSAEERERFSEFEQAKFADWQGRKLDTISIRFSVNEWEAERSIVHCYIAVQFRNLMKRVIIEIDVNKRNFLG